MYLLIVILVILGSFEICDGAQSFSIHEFFFRQDFLTDLVSYYS